MTSAARWPRRPRRDLSLGAFSDEPPWDLSGKALPWRDDVDALRSATARQVPRLLRRRALPPGRRVLLTALVLGWAVLAWRLVEKRVALRLGRPEVSRAGLSYRLRKAFEHLGPTYIKLGQILSSGKVSSRPSWWASSGCCGTGCRPSASTSSARWSRPTSGRPLEAVFEHFETTPIAAASIAQVHAARLCTGEEVVVKVQRPQVATLVERDIAAMSWLAPHLIGRIPVASLANPPALVELFAETIVEELDFRLEADNMLDIAAVLANTGQRRWSCPAPPRARDPAGAGHGTPRRLRLGRRRGHAPGRHRHHAVVRALLIVFLEGATLFGVFHGDLHGGNLLVRPDGRVALLDYGITGRLDEVRRLAFLRLLMGGASTTSASAGRPAGHGRRPRRHRPRRPGRRPRPRQAHGRPDDARPRGLAGRGARPHQTPARVRRPGSPRSSCCS